MGKIKLAKLIKSTKYALSKRSPEILIGLGIAGMFTTVILAVKATPKAMELIEGEEERREEELSKVDVVKTCWKCYVPAATMGVVSTACILGGHSVHARRTAAIATAYKVTETAFSDYRDTVIETIGEEREKKVRTEAHQKQVDREPVHNDDTVLLKDDTFLCMDAFSGQIFESNEREIKEAINVVNAIMNTDLYASVNDFYDALGIRYTDAGATFGWNMYREGLVRYHISSCVEKGRPILVVSFDNQPNKDFATFNL